MRKLAVLASAWLSFGVAHAADTELTIGTVVQGATVQGESIQKFAEDVNGRNLGVRISLFQGGQLGEGTQQAENVREGIQDGFIEDLTFFMQYSPRLRVANVPFLFRDQKHFALWLASPLFQEALTEVENNGGQHLIAGGEPWWRGPFRVLVSTKPVTTLGDVDAMRLRLWNSETITRFWGDKGLGATIQNVAWGEVYLALAQGVIDAVTSPFDLVTSSKFTEVAKHITMIDEFPQVIVLSINADKWNGLTEQQRTAVTEAWTTAGGQYNSKTSESTSVWRSQLEAAGVTFHDIDRPQFLARVNELNARYEKEGYWPAGMIEQIEKLN